MASTKDTVNNEQADVYRPTLPTSLNSEATLSVPSVIPPEHDHRTLVLCFDGTGDQFDADNSNIVQLVSLLKKNDRNKQMVYYQVSSHQLEYSSFSLITTSLASAPTPLPRLWRPGGQLSRRCLAFCRVVTY